MPGGISLLLALPADIPTPDVGRATIFINSATGQPSYKDDTGAVYTLVGAAGVTGASGPMGLPGYGFDGEEGEFLISQPGPQGNTGSIGLTGPTGLAGAPIYLIDEPLQGEDGVPGPVGPSGSAVGGDLLRAEITLTDAELRALQATPILMIPAPGVNKIIVALAMQIIIDVATAFSAAQSINARTVAGGSSIFVALSSRSNVLGRQFSRITVAVSGLSTLAAVYENSGIELFGNSVPTGGSTVAGCKVCIEYTIITFP